MEGISAIDRLSSDFVVVLLEVCSFVPSSVVPSLYYCSMCT